MESFILFSPFPLHSKFKFSIKILAFETLSKFIFALCGWRNFLEFKHKLFYVFRVTPSILIPFTLCYMVIEDYIILLSLCHASCKLWLLKKIVTGKWLTVNQHMGQRVGGHTSWCVGRIGFFTFTRKCPLLNKNVCLS